MIPVASGFAIGIVTLLLLLSSFSLALFIPYCEADVSAPFTMAFYTRGLDWAGLITGLGSLVGISACLLCTIYALPRVGYAMGADGLIFRFMGHVYSETQVPIYSICIFGTLAGVLAMLFELEVLADFLSIGTLIAYTIVSANTVALRYIRPRTYRSSAADSDEKQPILAVVPSASASDGFNSDLTAIGSLKPAYRELPLLRFVARARPGFVPVVALVAFIALCVRASSNSATQ